MTLEEFNSMNSSDNEHNCSWDDNFNTSCTSSTTDSGVTEDFQDAQSTLQSSDNILPVANSTTTEFDDTLLPASVTDRFNKRSSRNNCCRSTHTNHWSNGRLYDSGDYSNKTNHWSNGQHYASGDGSNWTTEPTIEATDGTMTVATTATEPTTEAMDGTMQVTTAAM